MSIRKTYFDSSTGEIDRNMRHIFNEKDESVKIKLLKIIKNELTARQTEIIMLYYIKNLSVTEIAEMNNISPQAVSALMSRARKKIYMYLKYLI